MENKYKIADNYECAKALDRFEQIKINALKRRIDTGTKYIASEKFDILIEEKKKKIKGQIGELREELFEMKKMYDTVRILVKRHENIVNELARIYAGIEGRILSKGKFPKELFSDQAKIMDEYYESLKGILEPCKLEDI